jgi:hypothetical protein
MFDETPTEGLGVVVSTVSQGEKSCAGSQLERKVFTIGDPVEVAQVRSLYVCEVTDVAVVDKILMATAPFKLD